MASNTTDHTASRSVKNKRLTAVSRTTLRKSATASEFIAFKESHPIIRLIIPRAPSVPPPISPEWVLFDDAGDIYTANFNFANPIRAGVSPVATSVWNTGEASNVLYTGTSYILVNTLSKTIHRSTDLIVWTNVYTTTQTLYYITIDESGILYALDYAVPSNLYKSLDDGITWIIKNTLPTRCLGLISVNGIIATVATNSANVYISTNGGTTFAQTANCIYPTLKSALYTGSLYVMSGDGGIVTSSDLITWVSKSAGISSAKILYNSSTGLYVGYMQANLSKPRYSTDLINWTDATTSIQYDGTYGLNRLFSNTQGYYALYGIAGADAVGVSSDGITWAALTNHPVAGRHFIAAFPKLTESTRQHI